MNSYPVDPRDPHRPFVTRRDDVAHFPLADRRREEDDARIAAARRAEAVSLLTRTLGRTPTDDEVANALAR
jgi:hypothetical protein